MNDIELDLLTQLTSAVLNEVADDQIISSDDLCEWHRRWLGNVYEWAGQYRTVNMGKGSYQFAASHQISVRIRRHQQSGTGVSLLFELGYSFIIHLLKISVWMWP